MRVTSKFPVFIIHTVIYVHQQLLIYMRCEMYG